MRREEPAHPIVIRIDADALERVSATAISELTEKATAATFYREGLSPPQLAANRRIVEISHDCCVAAARNEHQRLAAAFVGQRLAGYVIATRHRDDDLELDWLMVEPSFHGAGVGAALMQAGVEWLGERKPLWLNVISYNERAIAFYRRFGFEIDPNATTSHVIPHKIMRRSF